MGYLRRHSALGPASKTQYHSDKYPRSAENRRIYGGLPLRFLLLSH